MTDVAGTRHFIDVIALVISRDRRDNERGFPRMPYIFIHQTRTIDKTSYTSRPTDACGFSPWEATKHSYVCTWYKHVQYGHAMHTYMFPFISNHHQASAWIPKLHHCSGSSGYPIGVQRELHPLTDLIHYTNH